MCDMTHSYVWPIHMCDMTHSYVRHDSFVYVTWFIHTRKMTHAYVRHDSFVCKTRPTYMCNVIHSWYKSFTLCHDSFICKTWLVHMCDLTHSCVQTDAMTWHRSFSGLYMCCSVLQCVAACCSVLQSVAMCCSVLQCAVVCCSVFKCVADVRCNDLAWRFFEAVCVKWRIHTCAVTLSYVWDMRRDSFICLTHLNLCYTGVAHTLHGGDVCVWAHTCACVHEVLTVRQLISVRCSVQQRVEVCCSVLQCAAACCSVL